MTEKRFVGRYAGRTIKKLIGIEDIETNRVCVTIEENIRLLNELNDENQRLIKKIDMLERIIDVAVVRSNINCLVWKVRKELLKQTAMNYPKEEILND